MNDEKKASSLAELLDAQHIFAHSIQLTVDLPSRDRDSKLEQEPRKMQILPLIIKMRIRVCVQEEQEQDDEEGEEENDETRRRR